MTREASPDSTGRRHLVALILILLATRGVYTYFVPYLIGDTCHYIRHVGQVLAGQWSAIASLFFGAYFIPVAPLAALGIPAFPAAIIVGYVMAVLTALMIHQLVLHLGGSTRTALLAVFLYAVQPLAVQYGATAKMEHFFAFAFLGGIWFLAIPRRLPPLIAGIASGLSFGWAILLRNEGVFLLAGLLGAWLLERRLRRGDRPLAPHLMSAATCAVVILAWIALLSPRIDGAVFLRKTESINVGSQDDKEAFAALVIHVKEGNPIPQKTLGERLVHNLTYAPLSFGKAFFSPLALLPWVLLFIRPPSGSRRGIGVAALLLVIFLCYAGYASTTLFHRYLYLPVVLSIIAGSLGYAAIRRRLPGVAVRTALVLVVIGPLIVGTVLRTWHDHPKGLSTVGLADLYRKHIPVGSRVYVPFRHEPLGMEEVTQEMHIGHETLPQIQMGDLPTLLAEGEEEVFIWFDAYYIQSYFPDGEYLEGIESLEVDGVEVERVHKIEASRRNPGYLLRVHRRDMGG